MEKIQFAIVIALIINDKGEILLAKRNQPQDPEIHGKWEFVGGGIDFGEQPEEALLREVKEESGLEVKIVRLLPKVYTNLWEKADKIQQVIILPYECKPVGGVLGSDDQEIGELKYFKFSDINYANCLPKMKEIIDLLTIRA